MKPDRFIVQQGDPGSPQTNGRSEATVGVFKRGVRARFEAGRPRATVLGHVPRFNGQRFGWRWAEQQLGLQPDAILPFGAKVQVRRRPWELRGADGTKRGSQWLDRTQPALLLGPCDEVPGGYLVRPKGRKTIRMQWFCSLPLSSMTRFNSQLSLWNVMWKWGSPIQGRLLLGVCDPRAGRTRRRAVGSWTTMMRVISH